MNKDKVYLKGYVIGRSAYTLGYHGLMVQLENLNIVEIDKNLVHKEIGEPQKPVIPQFVADYIEFKKENDFHVYGAMRVIEDHYDKRVSEWFYEKNIETFARAWLDGYTVEKEPKYTVKFKATKQYLSNDELGPHFDPSFRSNFTKSDLEKLDLSWVFDCPGIEIEEVEG
jgi:phage protein|nr:MAG TPA: Protein of unknown function (DUF1642) [Caudoviricetes sp.]